MGLGSISAVIDSLEFDAGTCGYPHIIHISGEVYAVAYEGVDGDGWLATFTIDSAGNIGAAVIDTLEFDTVVAAHPRIINVSGTTYAIVYGVESGLSPPTKIVTVDITAAGQIGAAVIDTFSSAATSTSFPTIVHVSGDYFAVAHEISGNYGQVFTITITAAGDIGAAETDTLIFETTTCDYPDIIFISGTTYAVAYAGGALSGNFSDIGRLCTFDIQTNGQIGAAVIDTLQYETADAFSPRIIQVSGSVYAIAYSQYNLAAKAYVATVTINVDGTIDDAVIDTQEIDASDGGTPSIVKIGSSNLFAIGYRGVDNDGFIKTVNIASNGIISSVLGTLEFDTADGLTPSLVLVPNTTIVAVAYWGVDNDGWVKTAGISLVGELTGVIAVVQTRLHYVDAYGVERFIEGTVVT